MEYGRREQGGTTDAWERALRFSLANAAVFLLFSLMLSILEVDSLSILLSAPALFFLGAMMSFVLLVRSGGALAAIAWFVFGSGVYFGLGVLIGGLAPGQTSFYLISESALRADLIRINLLNSSSVVLVLITATPFCYAPGILNREHALDNRVTFGILLELFPLMTMLAIVAVGLRFLFFPIADVVLVATFLSYFHLVVPFWCLCLGMLWRRLEAHWSALGVLVFLTVFVISLLSMSKLEVMSVVLAVVVGTWVRRRTIFSAVGGLLLVAALYAYVGGLADEGRLHRDYHAVENSPRTRFEILADMILRDPGESEAAAVETIGDAIVPQTLVRFSVVAVQGYLMDAYESQNPGTSLADFWVAAIPRALWPDKPIITNVGADFFGLVWATPNPTSSLAPTYTGEAYWNYGPIGVVLVSILLGLEMGWLTHRWQVATRGLDPAFFLVALPAILLATFVENWIVPSYVGGFLTIVVLWLCARVYLRTLSGHTAAVSS